MSQKSHPILFFDGFCMLCNKSVDFILKRDPSLFLFAPLQGSTAQEKLDSNLIQKDLKSIVLLDDKGIHLKSKAVLKTLYKLQGGWKFVIIFFIIPEKIRDLIYDWIASSRYDWFGKSETCRLPSPSERKRFLN